MKTQIVPVPSIKNPITKCPGFAKKKLADFKLDQIALCQFGCRYCSSNSGNYLRINQRPFADLTEQHTGTRTMPAENPHLMFTWPDFSDRLAEQLAKKPADWGEGQTLVYSMLTDGFSPKLVNSGATEMVLQTLIERTGFRIRILTKNAIVGTPTWCDFFLKHPDRFVVGLSIGSLDDQWAKQVEMFTPPPSRRLHALNCLQDVGVATYGMLCPIFPDVLEGNRLDELVERIRPDVVEHVWAEPYNDRKNWEAVRKGYPKGSVGYQWLTRVYEEGSKHLWSEYATELYVRLRDKARRERWLHKLRFLLYEGAITPSDATHFRGLESVLLQSKPRPDGKSRNPAVATLQ